MSASDAAIAQGMATRHKRSVKAVVAGVGEINALLAKMIQPGKIKWGGFGTQFLWQVRKLKETSSWISGQLGTRSFEEKDPIDEAKLPYCFIDETYGVSEKSIKTNRTAGQMKLYDIQKENARNAQASLYRAFVDALYSNGDDALVPVGLFGPLGDCFETSNNVTTTGGYSYGGITVAASAVSVDNYVYSDVSSVFTNEYWYPVMADINEIPNIPGTPKWSTHSIHALNSIARRMWRTADVSGTSEIIKPDMALLDDTLYSALASLLITSQKDVAGVPLGTTDPVLAKFTTVRVGSLDVVYDPNVPKDSGSVSRAIVLDSKAFYIDSLNTKGEGLIEGEWTMKDPKVVGGIGMYKSNWGLVLKTPQAVGCIVGNSD